jgi:Cu2+-exporting ATPase
MTIAGTARGCRASCSPGRVRLNDASLFASPGSESCRSFLRRAFRLEEVRAVELAPGAGTATLHHTASDGTFANRLASELQSSSGAQDLLLGPIPTLDGSRTPFTVRRYGNVVSTWDAVHELPGRVRYRQRALALDRTLADRVARELPAVHGVHACQVRALTASLLVNYDPAVLDVRRLVHILDALLEGGHPSSLAYEGDPPPVRFGLANTSLGLAALGEFVVPALLPASAVLLVGSNVGTLRAAWQDARNGQVGLPALYSTILAGTLASGGFVAATLMSWMFAFWTHKHRERLLATRQELLPGIAQHARFGRLSAGDSRVDIPLERIRPGDRIVAGAGELLVADGRIVQGVAIVDERLVRGLDGMSRKRPGDRVFAGSLVVRGDLIFEAERLGRATRAAVLARAVLGVASATATRPHGETLARRAVVPTLATAGFGLLVGDLTTATAVLRPDYMTGPGLGLSQALLEAAGTCARGGILVREATAFTRLAEVDMVLFDDHQALLRPVLQVTRVRAWAGESEASVLRMAEMAFRGMADDRTRALSEACKARGLGLIGAERKVRTDPDLSFTHQGRHIAIDDAWDHPSAPTLLVLVDGREVGQIAFRPGARPAAATALSEWRREDPLPMGLVSSRSQSEAQALAAALGLEQYLGDLTSDGKAAVMAWYRDRGVKVAFVGDCLRESTAARQAHVAISLNDGSDLDVDPAAVLLLRQDLSRIAWLRVLARKHLACVRTIHGSAMIPNLACVAGAFLFGFTSLSSVIVTNLGTLGIYSGLIHRGVLASRARGTR